MHRVLLETTSALVAMQALGVLESARDADRRRIRRSAHVLHVNALQSLHLVIQRSVDRVVRMARIARHVRRNAVVLKVLGGNVIGVVYVKTLAIRNHYVARSAESCRFGALYMCV